MITVTEFFMKVQPMSFFVFLFKNKLVNNEFVLCVVKNKEHWETPVFL